jgi:hypothetical protein
LTHAVWVAASLLFILFGVPGSLSVRFATGIAIGGAVMYIESLLGIPWNRATLLIPALLCVAASAFARRVSNQKSAGLTSALLIVPALLTVYGIATARETCGDLLYFWGPKAQHFFFAHRIDVEFLKFPHYYLMHPDYPPLLPMVYAWNSIVAATFSYWGAMFLTPLYLLATTFAFRGFAEPKIGASKATAFAALLAALLAFGFAEGQVAGGADAQLIMFEVIALAALTFADAQVIAAIALAGAAFTKVEGAAFAVVVVVAYTLVRRDWRRSLVIAAPATILLGSWIAFGRYHGLIDSYARGGTPVHFDKLRFVLYVVGFEARYRVMYLPWILTLAPLGIGRSWRRAALPLVVAGASIAYTIFFYLHQPDAVWWIKASAERVLLTPLAALAVASAAASDYSRGRGVVPQGEEAERGGREADGDPGGPLAQVRRVQGDRLQEGSGGEPQRLPEMRLPLPPERA